MMEELNFEGMRNILNEISATYNGIENDGLRSLPEIDCANRKEFC